MIRSVLLIRLKPEATAGQVDDFMREIAAVQFPGRTNIVVARDLGRRPGNMDLCVSSDFPDELTFRAWFDDPGHGKVRVDYLQPIAAEVARCLIEVDT